MSESKMHYVTNPAVTFAQSAKVNAERTAVATVATDMTDRNGNSVTLEYERTEEFRERHSDSFVIRYRRSF